MAGIGPEDVHLLAVAFLAACVESLDTIPTLVSGYGGAPARAFVSPGQPSLDCCDQLAVHIGPISDGRTTGPTPSAPKFKINHVTLVATITRCIPGMEGTTFPTPSALTESAKQIDLDKWALWNHLFFMLDQGELFDRCGDVQFVSLNSLQPQGNCGGSTLTVRVSLDGYEEVPSS